MKGWLRLHRSILSKPKLQRLPADQFKAVINLWCMADETTGMLPVLEDIAFLLRLQNEATSDLLAALLAANLVGKGPGGRYFIHDWQEWQSPTVLKLDRLPAAERRAARMRIAGRVTNRMRKLILDRDGHRCMHCRATERLTIDHIVPVSRGGRSHPLNLQCLCLYCNSRKGGRMEITQ